jgi:glycerol-3-phosphate dehydrogenase
LEPIEQLPNQWAELRWAAREEGVEHLDDLLLRRVRLGLLLPRGGRDLLGRIRNIVQPELGWSDERWQQEEATYLKTWQSYYSPRPEEKPPG